MQSFLPKAPHVHTGMQRISMLLLFLVGLFFSPLSTLADNGSTSQLACDADAGALSPFSNNCIDGGTAELIAVVSQAPVVPEGFAVIYALTTGDELVIIDASATPEFTVTSEGEYRIHTLVYDPSTLNLAVIQFGITTGGSIANLLELGFTCGDLDVEGAFFNVDNCPCAAQAGMLTANIPVCIAGTAPLEAFFTGTPNVPPGFEIIFVLTETPNLTILEVNNSPEFEVTEPGLYRIHTLVYDPATLDLSIVEFGETTGYDVNSLLIQGGGNICAALDVNGAKFHVNDCPCGADAGTLNANSDNCLAGTADLSAVTGTTPDIPTGFEVIYVLTSGDDLVIQDVNATPDFTVSETGLYTIHTLVYDPTTLDLSIVQPGVTTGFDVNSLLIQGGGAICASLLVDGAKFEVEDCPCTADAGTLSSKLCFDNGEVLIGGIPNNDAVVPNGYETIYVLTSTDALIIEAVNSIPEFSISEDGTYRVHTLVYDPATLDLSIVEFGVTTGADVAGLLIQGGGAICASLDVEGVLFNIGECDDLFCTADAGTLTPANEECLNGTAELIAQTDEAPNVPAGYELLYVLTSTDDLIIQAVNTDPQFTVSEIGTYRIHTLVYDPATLDLSIVQFGVTTGVDVNNLLVQGGGTICASLDVAGALFEVEECQCEAMAGSLTTANPDACLDGNAVLEGEIVDTPVVPAGFEVLYVLTSGTGLIIEDASADPIFTVTETGIFTIHTLVYDPATLDLSIIEFGVTSGFDVNGLLQQGGGQICAALDVIGAPFNIDECPCTAEAGTLTADSDNCLDPDNGANLIAVTDQAPVVPAGYEVLYVLTSGNDLVIQNVSATPDFNVTEGGLYTIHTLVYNPLTLDLSIVEIGVTTGVDVNNLLIQGGGDICAALLVAGAQFDVQDCCLATAGTLQAANDPCLDGEATLEATVVDAPNVPAGYEVLYVLTSGAGLVIEAVNTDPNFTVTETGTFTIHTLVYDPNTLDLSIVEFGVTTGFDVNGLLQQGGGDICAALDVAGAPFEVEDCPCTAEAGTLTVDSDNCLDPDNGADLIAVTDQAPVVPAGYEVLYVLTSGNDLVIQNVSATPDFNVTEDGLYTIHTLVYNPLTLDLSIVQFGVTTGVDVNNLLIQGGGDICAALLVAGAQFDVQDCCTAEAGSLTAGNPDACLDGNAVLEGAVLQDPVVPAGYEVIYVLTSGTGLVIQDAAATPVFTVETTGIFTIHTLVYDPNTLDLSIVEFGVTTGFQVNNLLIQGGGDICAALDVIGAPFNISECPCTAEAGTLLASSNNCLDPDNGAELEAVEDVAPVVPTGYDVLYVLTSGNNLVIEAVSATPTFNVTEEGLYTIHTLVYNPLTLDLSIVEFGVTTGFDVNSLLQQGGGSICAALLVAGAEFNVVDCCLAEAGTLTPASDNCIDMNMGADLIATEDQAPVVPAGYEVLYVLTSGTGLVIEAVNADPVFNVTEEGLYTIHTLVYDPNTLDLSIVEIGVTTGFDVNSLLIQGGGDICAALLVAGAEFNVENCPSLQGGLEGFYPNPTSGNVYLPIPEGLQGTSFTIEVLNLNGVIIYTRQIDSANAEEILNLKAIAPGKYTIRLRKDNEMIPVKNPVVKF